MFNLKLALRTLFKTPFVTTVAALSLALGIGANTAIYSSYDAILRRPLPVFEPQRLANFIAPGPQDGSNNCNQSGSCIEVLSYPMFKDLEKNPGLFTNIVGHRMFGVNLAYDDQTPLNAEAAMVSGNYFSVLGLQPYRGRLLGPADDAVLGANFVTVLGYDFWDTRLGHDESVIGKPITVNGTKMTIVGIAPPGFQGTTLGSIPRVFVPISMRGVMNPGFRAFENRRNYWVYVFGRLKDGVTLKQAEDAINKVYNPIIQNVEAPLHTGMSDNTMKRFRARTLQIVDGRTGQSQTHQGAKTPIMLLFAVTGIVLLIACANIANLLLARSASRTMEMAVRLSLGASRAQVVGQLLTESVVLAIIGGLASIVVAKWTNDGIAALLPDQVTQTLDLSLRWPSVYFAATLALITGLLFGLYPALQSTKPDLVSELRNNSGKLSGGRGAARFRASLVTSQIALSMALLVFAGLFISSLAKVSRVDLGIKIDNIVMFTISPARSGYDSTRTKGVFERVEQELAGIPGVTGVTASAIPILANNNSGNSVRVQGFKTGPDIDNGSRLNFVGPDYFRTLGIKMIAGREFQPSDVVGSGKVVIVNESFAKKFGLGRDVVGRVMSQNDSGPLDEQIIGFVQDAKYSSVKDTIPPQYFAPYKQLTNIGRMNFYARTAGDPISLLRAIPAAIKRIDPSLPVEDLKTLPQQVKDNIFLDRMISTMSGAFAILATILAAIGLYGVLAYSVAQRTREIGVRMALGADSRKVQGMVLRQVGRMLIIGGAIGIAGAIALGRGARSILFEVTASDPVVLVSAAILLTIVALAAGYVPALRASKIHPMQALRYE